MDDVVAASGEPQAENKNQQSKLTRVLMIAVWAVAVIAVLVPVWSVEYVPLLDYPNHLARAFVLHEIHNPAFKFDQWMTADWGPYPYLGMDVTMSLLLRIFPIMVAGRIFMSLCLLAIPAGTWIFLREASPGNEHMALWSLLLSYDSYFLEGFLNFYLSIGVCFFALGLWMRYYNEPSRRKWVEAALGILLLYFTHAMGFGAVGVLVGSYVIIGERNIKKIVLNGMLFLPPTLLAIGFMKDQSSVRSDMNFLPWEDKINALTVPLHSYSEQLDDVTLYVIPIAIIAAMLWSKERGWSWRWAGATSILLTTYFALPSNYGQSWDLDIRLLPIIGVLGVTALCRMGARGRWLAPVALALVIARATVVTQHFKEAEPELKAIAQAFAMTPRDVKVLPIVADPMHADTDEIDPILRPWTHFWAYGAIERGWYVPYLFAIKGQIPLKYKLDLYAPDGFWDLRYKDAPDWYDVQTDYDYVWAYNVPQYEKALEEIGDVVVKQGDLVLIKIRKTTPTTEERRK